MFFESSAEVGFILSSGETSVLRSWLSRSDEDKIRRLERSDQLVAWERAPSIDNLQGTRIHLVEYGQLIVLSG